MIDDEIYADVFRTLRGVEVDEDRLALEVIDKVGHMGNFLAQRHTMKLLKMGEVRNSSLYDKRTMEKARKEGIRPLHEAAREVAKKTLKEHVSEPLDRDIQEDLSKVVKEAGKELVARS